MAPLIRALLGIAAALAAPAAPAADAVARALAVPVTASWEGLPLRVAAERLAEIGRLAVVVDRRIDPGTPVSLDAERERLADVLGRVAAGAGAEAVAYAGHVRLVPAGRAAALAAAERLRADELRALAPRFRATALASREAAWPDGAVPDELAAAAAAEAGIVIAGLDALPHDHFPAARLPPLPFAHRVDLVLAHFDRRVSWRPQAGGGAAAVVYALVAIPDAVVAAGPLLPAPAKPAAPAAPAAAEAAAATYTLTVAAPLEELLATLARRFGLVLELDRAGLARAGVAPGEIVRLEERDATRERLLDAIARPRGLAWRIEGRTLSVSAAPR